MAPYPLWTYMAVRFPGPLNQSEIEEDSANSVKQLTEINRNKYGSKVQVDTRSAAAAAVTLPKHRGKKNVTISVKKLLSRIRNAHV